ncbi:hypothetical protein PhaeoP83_02663 [Phaeobacter inhibens]|uniref:Lipoprotein n=1 Tax=Phaeobacter inhibens TaxID=221822 RepID=A0ABN5GUI5_9RHOB|nr:hypothetical protein [Phaeobacter inhibens]AUQ50913.1 hypothetical protein PhaeoP83_02663 [Phaeobacter inhibens]AUQ96441.1 hypothetical protein PhaeoP66_03711 [Phaeobacter inhibens]AUR20718.1 hypothetical protein PhaeoP80_02663 [Phaeobacter inhibens]
MRHSIPRKRTSDLGTIPKATISVSLICALGLLAACQTTTQQITEEPQRPTYRTQSERVVERLATCVATRGNAACQTQARAACTTIQGEAFNNPYSAGTTLANFTKGNAETRARFKLSTANTVMRELGYGQSFCG